MTTFESSPHNESTEGSDLEEAELLARKIARSGNFYDIKEELEEKDLLETEKIRVKSEYKDNLDKIDFLTDSDLEMFTIIELYDKNLAMHSLETFLLAKEKAEKKLAFDIVLIDVFADENVTPEQFFRACFLHDVGKVYVPNFILNDETSIAEMSALLDKLLEENNEVVLANIARLTAEDVSNKNKEELLELLKQSHLRPVHVVPIKHILTEEQIAITENSYKIDSDLSLMDVIETHEGYSEDILRTAGYDTEADLAGAHHNYHGRGSSHERTIEALQLSVDTVELLRIADITHALGDSRSYNKTGFNVPAIWRVILEEVQSGKITEIMAYIWLEDEVKIFEKDKANLENITLQDQENIQFVKTELEKMYANISSREVVEDFHFPRAA